MPHSPITGHGWEPKFSTDEQWNFPSVSLKVWHQSKTTSWSLSFSFFFWGLTAVWVRGVLGDPARLPGCRNESSSEGRAWKHLIVLPSQSHRYKPASVSPPQPLLNVFTRAPLSVPFCYYKALAFNAWAMQKDIPLYFPTPLPSSHTEELINNIPLPLSPGKGSPYYKTWRDHTVTLCEAVQDEAIKAGFFFFPQNKGHILLEDAEGSQWQQPLLSTEI